GLVGAVVALVVDAPRDELGGAVLAQVVGQALPVQPAGKAVLHDQQLVVGDGVKMPPDVHTLHSFLYFFALKFQISHSGPERRALFLRPVAHPQLSLLQGLQVRALGKVLPVPGEAGVVVGVVQDVLPAMAVVQALLLGGKAPDLDRVLVVAAAALALVVAEPGVGGPQDMVPGVPHPEAEVDRKSTRLNSSHVSISYAVFCLKNKTKK